MTVWRRRSGKRLPTSAPTAVPATTVATLVMVPTNIAGMLGAGCSGKATTGLVGRTIRCGERAPGR